jgi:para-aminobenzoate synthetase component I
MYRVSKVFNIPDQNLFKEKILDWSRQFEEIIWLDSNAYPHLYPEFDAILAVDALTRIKTAAKKGLFAQLEAYREVAKDWIFGYFSYEVKNAIEELSSNNLDELHFPEVYFFQPKKMIFIKNHKATFSYLPMVKEDMENDFRKILKTQISNSKSNEAEHRLKIVPRFQKKEYLVCVKKIIAHIQRGDSYEVNFCQEFYAKNVDLDMAKIYKKLNAISQTPFSAYLRLQEYYVVSASPERYLKKEHAKIIAQPIKGTAKRALDAQEDERLKTTLENNPKERAENIMIVDLVRNDLAKIAQKGTVLVEELCKVYAFKPLHQMISTITCIAKDNINPLTAIKASFPMGSMTGAPKISAMKIIETLEKTKRGLYSGAMGYFSPEGDFDFNVVIRSILYNAERKYVSYSVGSAITAKSIPEEEYEECLAKAAIMKQVLEDNS